MESELSLTASFIPDGLNYFITINDTPSASCAVLPDVQRPQSHSPLWRLVTSCPLKDVPLVLARDDTSICLAPLFASLSNNGERCRKAWEIQNFIEGILCEVLRIWRSLLLVTEVLCFGVCEETETEQLMLTFKHANFSHSSLFFEPNAVSHILFQ